MEVYCCECKKRIGICLEGGAIPRLYCLPCGNTAWNEEIERDGTP